jgi:hypothetical protein
MNNINIKNIFANSQDNPNNNLESNVSDISVHNLVKSNTFSAMVDDNYIINKIKKNKKDELDKTNELYETKYKECLMKINNAIDLNLTDTIYSVGLSYFGYNNYNSIKCLLYIQEKLRSKGLLTLITGTKEIFISWISVE